MLTSIKHTLLRNHPKTYTIFFYSVTVATANLKMFSTLQSYTKCPVTGGSNVNVVI